MLEVPKAHIPKQRDEISSGVMVTKVEKSCEMKYGQTLTFNIMDNQAGKSRIGKPSTTIAKASTQ